MSRWKQWAGAFARKARGVLGLSFIGGTIAAIGGSLLTAAAIIIEFGGPMSREIPEVLAGALAELAGVFFMLGALTTGGFAVLLSVTSRRLTLSELSIPRAALAGAIVGMLVPATIVAVEAGLPFLLASLVDALPALASFGAIGGALSAGLVATAKRAEARELRAVDEIKGELEVH